MTLPLELVHGHIPCRKRLGLQQTLEAEQHRLLQHFTADPHADLLVHGALATKHTTADLA